MGKIVVSENVTLDGVVEDPAGAEGFRRGGWVGRVGARGREEAAKVLLDEALGAEAQLFGRRTYEFLAARWPSLSGELADRLNDMPKYVVSDWNSTVLAGRRAGGLEAEQGLDGEIVVAGSIRLVRTLMENDLVDELRLMIYPVVVGAGERLFGVTCDQGRCASLGPGPSPTAPTSPTRSSARQHELLRHVDRGRRRLSGH
jgi:dihydrofolate reductase